MLLKKIHSTNNFLPMYSAFRKLGSSTKRGWSSWQSGKASLSFNLGCKGKHLRGAFLVEQGESRCIMIGDHKGRATHPIGLVHQQVASLRLRIISYHKACR